MVASEILDHYGDGKEEHRLTRSLGRLEWIRGWVNEDLDAWLDDDAARERLLHVLCRMESEPSLLEASAHLIAVAHK